MLGTDFAISSTRVHLPEGPRPATIVVENGKIARIGPAGRGQDLGEAAIFPALADCHVHINEPGRTEWEGFETATKAAAVGGITTLVDMPLNSDPVTTSVAALEAKLAATPGKLTVDVGFWGGVVPDNLGELAPMVEGGVLGFKAFLCHSGIDDFPDVGPETLRPAMATLREAGVPLLVHAELEQPLRQALLDADPRAYLTYLHSRPKEWEDAAIALMIALCRETGCRVHVVHLSSSTALPMIRAAKAEGLPLTVETCPHYLCLRAEEVPDGATAFKCAPPIRDNANRAALWAALADGTIDFVISDHSPCVPGLKLPETGDFMGAWGGIASLQLGLANVWTEARARGHSLTDVLRWMGTGPRAFLGRHRRIAEGEPADLVVFEADRAWEVAATDLVQRHPITPYLGRTVTGQVRHTWLRGTPLVADGQLTGARPGRLLLGTP